jgi:hypothetical protein
MLLLLAL